MSYRLVIHLYRNLHDTCLCAALTCLYGQATIATDIFICVFAGSTGSKGTKGTAGHPGHQGFKGDQGVKGDKGVAGLPGIGLPGLPGEKVHVYVQTCELVKSMSITLISNLFRKENLATYIYINSGRSDHSL